MSKHDLSELYQLQGLSLNKKIERTQARIKQWVEHYGLDHVYVSFSGGKDSTVLLDIARKMYPEIKAVFLDTSLEYPELRKFVQTFENVDILKPKMNFRQVIEKYGYPVISKEVSECVYGAKKYLTSLLNEQSLNRQTDRQTDHITTHLKNSLELANIAETSHLASIRGGQRHIYNYECDRLFGTCGNRLGFHSEDIGKERIRQRRFDSEISVTHGDNDSRQENKGEYP